MTARNRPPEKTPVIRTPSRREFLTKGAMLAGGTMIFGLPFLTGRTRLAHAAQGQAPQASRYALVLDGPVVGFLKSVEGGFVSGQVVAQRLGGGTNILKKHLAAITYEDISIQCGGNMASGFYQWIQASIDGQINKMNGTILKTNMNNQVIEARDFHNAIITEVAFPALDATSNAPSLFKVTITPEHTSLQAGSGSQISGPPQTSMSNLLSSNFRLNIRDLEDASAFIQTIEPLVWKRTLVQSQTGNFQEIKTAPQPADIPNLVFTLPESQAGPFAEWFHYFVIQGHTADEHERSGLLELLTPDQQQVLFTISFGNLGIFRMSPVLSSDGTSSFVKVEMYCETMQFTQGSMSGSSSAQQQTAPPSRRRPSSKKRRPRRKIR